MSGIYNSALSRAPSRDDVEPTERFRSGLYSGMRWNIVNEPPPAEVYQCDVIYCEPPFPRGLKVFDERAGEKTDGYDAFAKAFAGVWGTIEAPKYAITNARLLRALPKPDGSIRVSLNGAPEWLSFWGAPEPEGRTNLDVCGWIGRRYQRMGDFTCGCGMPLITFARARRGNGFFGSDYDAKCITVLKNLAAGLSL